MTDLEITSRIALMRSIDKPTIDLPLATVERLMATKTIGKVKLTNHKTGKTTISPIAKMPVSKKIGAKAKADRREEGYRANRKGAK